MLSMAIAALRLQDGLTIKMHLKLCSTTLVKCKDLALTDKECYSCPVYIINKIRRYQAVWTTFVANKIPIMRKILNCSSRIKLTIWLCPLSQMKT
jgi:hypothetical protein